MPGSKISVLPRITYNYTVIPASVQSQMTYIVKGVDVSSYREATPLLRVHSYTISQAGAAILVTFGTSAPSAEDPSTVFSAPYLTQISIDQSLTAPVLLSSAIPAGFGSMLWVGIAGLQASTPGSLIATISIDLSLKN